MKYKRFLTLYPKLKKELSEKDECIISTKNRTFTFTKEDIKTLDVLFEYETFVLSSLTKEGLDKRKKSGLKLGRPFGAKNKKKVSDNSEYIKQLLSENKTIKEISQIFNCSERTIRNIVSQIKEGNV